MITPDEWSKIKISLENAFGEDSLMKTSETEAFVFVNDIAVALIKSPTDSINMLYIRLTSLPNIAAYVACLLQKNMDFYLADHFDLNEEGTVITEKEALDALRKRTKDFYDKEEKKVSVDNSKKNSYH